VKEYNTQEEALLALRAVGVELVEVRCALDRNGRPCRRVVARVFEAPAAPAAIWAAPGTTPGGEREKWFAEYLQSASGLFPSDNELMGGVAPMWCRRHGHLVLRQTDNEDLGERELRAAIEEARQRRRSGRLHRPVTVLPAMVSIRGVIDIHFGDAT
jgi:hypothetical protein